MSNWEEALLGTVVSDPGALKACDTIMPSDFTGANQVAYAEILALAERNAVGPRSLAESLRGSPDFTRFANVSSADVYVANLINLRGAEPDEYVRHVVDASIRRTVKRNCALIAAEADGDTRQIDDLIDFAETKMMALRRNRGEGAVTMGDLVKVFMPRLQALRDGTFVPVWAPKITPLAEIIDYVEPSESLLYAARPGIGKSSLLRFEFFMASLRDKKRVGIINLENDENDYIRGFLALHTAIDSRKIKTGHLTDEELERVKLAARTIANMPIFLASMPSPSAKEVRRRLRRMVTENQIEMAGIDYVQLMSNDKEKANDDVSISSRELRASARELLIPHHVIAQLNRNIETRGDDAEPQLSDLRDSGSLEQDATIITFMKPAWTNPTDDMIRQFEQNIDPKTKKTLPRPRAIPMRLYVRKNRNGEIGTSDPVLFDRATGRFIPIPVER